MAKSNPVVRHLNILLTNELTAINQYFLHARMLRHLGYSKLAEKEYEESVDEMKHADALVQRILMIGGLPNLQEIGKMSVGENAKEMLEADYTLEKKARADLLAAHAACEGDPTSINLIEAILESEEQHMEWLEAQLGLIKAMGLENYLQAQL